MKVVGNNMKSLEVSEQEALQREDSYEETIRDLTGRLKDVSFEQQTKRKSEWLKFNV